MTFARTHSGYKQAYLPEQIVYWNSKEFRHCYETIYLVESMRQEGSFFELSLRSTQNGLHRGTLRLREDIAKKLASEYNLMGVEQLVHKEFDGYADELSHRPRGLL